MEQQPARLRKLEAFRDLVKSRLCKFYSSPADLGAKVSRSLTQLRKQHPRPGWIRADAVAALPSADEVLRLKSENEELRRRLERYGLEEPKTREHLASGSEAYELDFVFSRTEKNEETGGYRSKGDQWETVEISWDQIFALLGPSILKTNWEYWSASRELASYVERHVRHYLAKK